MQAQAIPPVRLLALHGGRHQSVQLLWLHKASGACGHMFCRAWTEVGTWRSLLNAGIAVRLPPCGSWLLVCLEVPAVEDNQMPGRGMQCGCFVGIRLLVAVMAWIEVGTWRSR